ncbi:MAG TPA: 1-(5-phosphoribosyl)-5-[(5-phosphoribosylamino)methylideneamino]imidazole-4-carboxamide isomerase [bacterium]|nr:1-(5-phosphoribosyl)-5-[(5-phosphoribosylamino)methylideneamino]imidazole-4-carboxamide isomerase [bacterium]HEX67666.1 1-(5-phosphoribosyl)-5-[(5-phosphoribosylamino)methylideneamino]imidazole-4-carboxamide isomerase [bacterium]
MLLIPAIDLLEGKVVRLFKGEFSQPTYYPFTPLEVLKMWEEWGFRRIHVVDLEGAKYGETRHRDLILQLKKNFNGKIEVGGGIREEKDIEEYLSGGIDYVILGTKAVELDFLKKVSEKYPGRIIVSLDLKGEKLGIKGWKWGVRLELDKWIKEASLLPLESFIFTDISRDGTLEGVNIAFLEKLKKWSNLPLILGGGISNAKDLEIIHSLLPNVKGVIVGKALYEGKIKREEVEKWLNIS